MKKYQICTKKRLSYWAVQYLRGGTDAIRNGKIVVAPHSSGRDLNNVIEWVRGYGHRCGQVKVTQSRNKREGYYVGKHNWIIKKEKIHFWKYGRKHHHRGDYPTTVNRHLYTWGSHGKLVRLD
jgi:hypothetical protein